MPWLNEQRFKNAKVVQNDADPNRYRISATLGKLHYESTLGSGNFDTDVDLTPRRVNGAQLNGWLIDSNSWHFAYQGFAATGQQPPQGTLAYGGRKGSNWFRMRPYRLGFVHWPTRTLQAVGGAPTFNTPTLETQTKQLGINDDDPVTWNVASTMRASLGDLWTTANGGSVEWRITASSGRLKQDFIINQAARDAMTQWWQANGTNPASETWFCVAYQIDLSDLPGITNDDVPLTNGSDVEPTSRLRFRDSVGNVLGRMQNGDIYVRNRGGSVQLRKRLYRQGGQWFLLVGANVAEMASNLLPGDLVIDPPIAEEDIGANSDDAYEAAGTINLSGYGGGGIDYLGSNADNNHIGWRFTSLPIANGATVNSATLEPRQTSTFGTIANITARLYAEDVDDAATFTTAANNVSGRTRTTAFTALATADWPGNGTRASWDVSGALDEIINRAGWTSNNDIAFLAITQSATYDYVGFNDYSGGTANAADFNADVTAGGGGGATIPIFTRHYDRMKKR